MAKMPGVQLTEQRAAEHEGIHLAPIARLGAYPLAGVGGLGRGAEK
jgi:hypothetical protein